MHTFVLPCNVTTAEPQMSFLSVPHWHQSDQLSQTVATLLLCFFFFNGGQALLSFLLMQTCFCKEQSSISNLWNFGFFCFHWEQIELDTPYVMCSFTSSLALTKEDVKLHQISCNFPHFIDL